MTSLKAHMNTCDALGGFCNMSSHSFVEATWNKSCRQKMLQRASNLITFCARAWSCSLIWSQQLHALAPRVMEGIKKYDDWPCSKPVFDPSLDPEKLRQRLYQHNKLSPECKAHTGFEQVLLIRFHTKPCASLGISLRLKCIYRLHFETLIPAVCFVSYRWRFL